MNKLFITGLFLIQFLFSNSQDYSKFEVKGKFGFKNKNGVVKIPATFDGAWDKFSKGLVGVKKGKKWGYIDSTGKTIIAFKYDEVGEFLSLEIASVFIGDLNGFINTSGKIVVPIIYDMGNLTFNNGDNSSWIEYHTFRATRNNKATIMDFTGKVKIPPVYDELNYVYITGGAFYIVKSKGKYGTIDLDNKEIIPIKYDLIEKELNINSNRRLKVKFGSKEEFVDLTGKTL